MDLNSLTIKQLSERLSAVGLDKPTAKQGLILLLEDHTRQSRRQNQIMELAAIEREMIAGPGEAELKDLLHRIIRTLLSGFDFSLPKLPESLDVRMDLSMQISHTQTQTEILEINEQNFMGGRAPSVDVMVLTGFSTEDVDENEVEDEDNKKEEEDEDEKEEEEDEEEEEEEEDEDEEEEEEEEDEDKDDEEESEDSIDNSSPLARQSQRFMSGSRKRKIEDTAKLSLSSNFTADADLTLDEHTQENEVLETSSITGSALAQQPKKKQKRISGRFASGHA